MFQANLAAERREKLAVATVLNEKQDLETLINNLRVQLEGANKSSRQMEKERDEAMSQLRDVEKKSEIVISGVVFVVFCLI